MCIRCERTGRDSGYVCPGCIDRLGLKIHPDTLNYFKLQDVAEHYKLDFNAFCAAYRECLASGVK